jgi:hypothetical protein
MFANVGLGTALARDAVALPKPKSPFPPASRVKDDVEDEDECDDEGAVDEGVQMMTSPSRVFFNSCSSASLPETLTVVVSSSAGAWGTDESF